MSKIITAKEISKQLPMRVKSLTNKGMFKGTIIRFDKINDQGDLLGVVVGDTKRKICIINSSTEFELLK